MLRNAGAANQDQNWKNILVDSDDHVWFIDYGPNTMSGKDGGPGYGEATGMALPLEQTALMPSTIKHFINQFTMNNKAFSSSRRLKSRTGVKRKVLKAALQEKDAI